jgi:type I restriction enzyme M protein
MCAQRDEFIVDKVSGRIISAGPEEVDATQPLLELLIREAGWDPKQIISRPNQWRVRASPSGKRIWPVDVAIFDDAAKARDPDHVIIICECKKPNVNTGIEQLKIYLDREPNAKIGVWFNGIEHAIVYKTTKGYITADPGTPIPTVHDPLVPAGRRVLTYKDLRIAPSLVPVFKRIRDRLATLDSNVNRDEEILPDISLLLLLKILDEQTHRTKPDSPLEFQIDDDATRTAKRIKELLERSVSKYPELFGVQEARFSIDTDSINYVVQILQNYRLLSNDADAVAEAFQVIRGKAFKGEEGQYFTPQSVVKVAVAAIDPRPEDRIIDPGCGSGSFLAESLRNVVAILKEVLGNDAEVNQIKREWATQQLFAIDKDAVSVRLSKAYLSMLGDGSTHVYKADSIRPSLWSKRHDNLSAVAKDGSFSAVITNPPFGTKLKVTPEIGRIENYVFSRKWTKKGDSWSPTDKYESRELGLIFLERCINLLQDKGRLAIVLPDTYLFSPTYEWLTEYLLKNFTVTHSINVPIEAFEPHCRAKTSIIVLKKEKPAPDNEIIGSTCETFGEDKHQRPRYKIVSGIKTQELDDEMADTAKLLVLSRKRELSDRSELFRFTQKDAINKRVLVAKYWWRSPYMKALDDFAKRYNCVLVPVKDILEKGELEVFPGHGSPSSHYHGHGNVPYIKVTDIKNWQINENPEYMIPENIATKLRKNKKLQPFDLVTPTRASQNIGLFGVIMPWQTNVILTREIHVWRVRKDAKTIDPFLLLNLMSLKVVHDQFNFLVLMQTNREDLSDRYKELLLPIPSEEKTREKWSVPIRNYFEMQIKSRESYDKIKEILDSDLFADRP